MLHNTAAGEWPNHHGISRMVCELVRVALAEMTRQDEKDNFKVRSGNRNLSGVWTKTASLTRFHSPGTQASRPKSS